MDTVVVCLTKMCNKLRQDLVTAVGQKVQWKACAVSSFSLTIVERRFCFVGLNAALLESYSDAYAYDQAKHCRV
jgi:uncharacterized membrane protein